MSRYKTLLFDLDGTLFDSAPGILSSIRFALDELGIPEPPDMWRFLGPPLFVSLKEFCGLDDEKAWDVVGIYREKYPTDEYIFNASVFDGVEEILKELKAAGLTLAVATSKPVPFAKKLVEHFGLIEYFDFIGGSGLDNSRGSKREVIEYVLENLGETDRSSVLMIGDRKHDVLGAKECGLDCLYVLWGYGSSEEAAESGAFATVVTPRECLEFILG